MPQLILIKYESNYADEFDVVGFVVWTQTKWEAHKTAVTTWFDNRSKKRGEKPVLPPHNDPKYYEVYDQLRKYERGQEVERYFGTNEAVNYSSVEDYLGCFKIMEITVGEHEALKRLFGEVWREDIQFGMFLALEDLEDEEA